MLYQPIRNSAQLTPSAVRFQVAAPPADLAGQVMDFWQYDVREPLDIVRIQVFPSGCVVLRFNLDPHGAEAIVYGPSLRPTMRSIFVGGVSAFGAALRLEAARDILRCDVAELCDLRLGQELFFGRRLPALCESLWRTQSFEDRTQVLASFLRARSNGRRTPHGDFLEALSHIERGARTTPLPRALRISERTLRRHFDRHVGLAPKQLERVVRVQTALRALVARPDSPATRLALDAGFSDQPHFSREFKRLMGLTPGAFARCHPRFHDPTLPIWDELNQRL
ncbi:MAG: helix-turn-helix domain-containing protein, partial [Myxococcales bacterium]|nr:helix-turn-helix domain-containing protein [Myxococcales bacterium]